MSNDYLIFIRLQDKIENRIEIRMKTKKGDRSNVKKLFIVGIIIIISIIFILLFLTPTKRITEAKNEKITLIRNEAVDSEKENPHFIVDQEFVSSQLCVSERLSSFNSMDVIENIPVILNGEVMESDSHWQLCVAKHNHQHAFKLKVSPDLMHREPQEILKVNCDLFLSTSAVLPSADNWDWKTSNDITIYSYATEFQKSALNALFISMRGIGCALELEVITVPIEELLRKISLRGGQRILPRDLDRLMNGNS